MLLAVTLVAVCLVIYTYALFPLILLVRGWAFPRPWSREDQTPTVSIIMICHNEAADIESKLINVTQLDYPREQVQIVVGSDGSDDGTDELVQNFADPRVELHSYARRGKIPALNDTVAQATGEILVFTDANSQLNSDALRKLTRHFADPLIGCVAGNQVYTDQSGEGAAAAGEKSYWNFDRLLKSAQSTAGNATSATGALYAIRRNLFQPVPSGVTDDFAISTRAIRQGSRLVFDPEAIAAEPVAGKPAAEFRRKVRVMTRGLRAVWLARELLNPFRFGFYSLQLFSHKVLRRVVVLPLLILLALTPWMFGQSLPLKVLAIAQWLLYGSALVGWLTSGIDFKLLKPFRICYFFVLVNWAALVACWNVLSGRRIEQWNSGRGNPSSEASDVAKQPESSDERLLQLAERNE